MLYFVLHKAAVPRSMPTRPRSKMADRSDREEYRKMNRDSKSSQASKVNFSIYEFNIVA